MQVDFYHLAAWPLEKVLPSLCEKVLAGGGRMLVVADRARLAGLDSMLWNLGAESFLPHGLDQAERQPVLLAETAEPRNGARNIAIVDGRWRDEALAFDRAFFLFDNDAIDHARAAWRALKAKEGLTLHYWDAAARGRGRDG
jgi:DNA polymerase III subunit chi